MIEQHVDRGRRQIHVRDAMFLDGSDYRSRIEARQHDVGRAQRQRDDKLEHEPRIAHHRREIGTRPEYRREQDERDQ